MRTLSMIARVLVAVLLSSAVSVRAAPGRWVRKGQATIFTEAEWAELIQKASGFDELLTRHSAGASLTTLLSKTSSFGRFAPSG